MWCTDEWCNPTILVVLPLLGHLTVRYRLDRPIRGFADGPCDECVEEFGAPACSYCHQLHQPPCTEAEYHETCRVEVEEVAREMATPWWRCTFI